MMKGAVRSSYCLLGILTYVNGWRGKPFYYHHALYNIQRVETREEEKRYTGP